jgi:hypothetical protein
MIENDHELALAIAVESDIRVFPIVGNVSRSQHRLEYRPFFDRFAVYRLSITHNFCS